MPMIPLGLKETRELDWATPLKVGAGLGSWGAPWYSPIAEQMRKQAPEEKGSGPGAAQRARAVGDSDWVGLGDDPRLGWVWQSRPSC